MPTKSDETSASAPETGTRLSAEEIHENVLVQAEDEMKRPASDLFWSAVTAGLTIGWSFVGGAYVSTLVGPEYRRAAQAALYPLGFILVIIGRSQLFTENTLEPVIPVLDHPTGEKLGKMFRLWGLVLLGNMIGAAAFALLFAHTNVVSAEVGDRMREMSAKAMEGSSQTVAVEVRYSFVSRRFPSLLRGSTRDRSARRSPAERAAPPCARREWGTRAPPRAR